MKTRLLFVSGVCLLIGLAGGSAHIETGGIRARVPFDLNVSGKILSTVDCAVAASPLGIAIQNDRGNVLAMALASEISGRPATAKGQIVFRCYGSGCILSEILSPNCHSGQLLLLWGAEAEPARLQSQSELAVLREMMSGRDELN